ncbi:glucose 1-dehydrogenase [Steroidobacter agaridevorans]|uniref:glucose 1-dehydrogenase n=1 Tax=Steroidobacter agaridevorans TaxID=2695856 RepID=UPI001323FDDC|nr:glucose 1-dehydrogenase [Steroidobacter agaridevorans]GFE90802.1 short-chain dehydrogenase [Steroidobacter agaridevorans]
MNQLQERVAIVTGGAMGLGSAIVRRLAAEGARTVITDIQVAAGEQLASELGGCFIEHDVTDENRWDTVVRAVEDRFGRVDFLINNAGVEGPPPERANPENTRLSDWQAVHRVNVEGVFLGCRATLPALRRAGGGAIINMSSTAGLCGTPDYIAYGASKAAVWHLTKSVALHCARNGSKIRCNSVHPALVLTPMVERIIADTAAARGTSTEDVTKEFTSLIPQREFQTLDDIAAAVLFLTSDEARHITGLAMTVDGGCSAAL